MSHRQLHTELDTELEVSDEKLQNMRQNTSFCKGISKLSIATFWTIDEHKSKNTVPVFSVEVQSRQMTLRYARTRY